MNIAYNSATYKGTAEVPKVVRLSALEGIMGDGRTVNELIDFVEKSIEKNRQLSRPEDSELMQHELDFIKNTKDEDWEIGGEKNRNLYTVEIPYDNGHN